MTADHERPCWYCSWPGGSGRSCPNCTPDLTELDEFVSELRDRIDEIQGHRLVIEDREVWLHTPAQIDRWIGEAISVWRSYRDPQEAAGQ